MAIDPMLYQKLSGRKGDPYTRLGEVLAKDTKSRHARDAMPKGVGGGWRVMRLPGIFANLWFWFANRKRERDNK